MQVTVPGKFFIAGEYAALVGGATLTVAVAPSFEWTYDSQASTSFHPESPAGLLSSQPLPGKILDPYHGLGGMGFSTAEFLLQSVSLQKPDKMDSTWIWQTWRKYRELQKNKKNIPSGVDLITQSLGGYVVTQIQSSYFKKHVWPFPDLDWMVFLTGHKLKTHSHLEMDLQSKIDAIGLQNSKAVTTAFESANAEQFIKSLNEFHGWLKQKGFETEKTNEMIADIQKSVPLVAIKGCGAMGSDALFLLFEKNKKSQVTTAIKKWAHPQSPLLSQNQVNMNGMSLYDEN